MLCALAVLAGLGFLASAFGEQFPWLLMLFCCPLGVVGVDTVLASRLARLYISRNVNDSISVGVPCEVTLTVITDSNFLLSLQVWDHLPPSFACQAFPIATRVSQARPACIRYNITPENRGEYNFSVTELRVQSPLRMWWRKCTLETPATIKVYPDFSRVTKYMRLSTDLRNSVFGVRRLRRRGIGSEFQELRDYREGDAIRQVDWRATARTRRLISREYQPERNQRVVFLLDCGRRMRAKEISTLSHFDESLNATLVLSYVALRQGDSVAIGTFGHSVDASSRWMGPVKGPSLTNHVLNALYDLEPSTLMPDYLEAARDLMSRHPKRALVVIVTNLRGEDSQDLLLALRVLRKRHLVLLVSLRESVLDLYADAPIVDLSGALTASGIAEINAEREGLLRHIRAQGVLVLDSKPIALSAELLNMYLALKARQAI